jgi:DNA-binding response OmpR family regulator
VSLDVRGSVNRRVIRTPSRPVVRAHVLIVSPDSTRASHLRSVLLRGHFSARVATPERLLALARACVAPNVIVLDMTDPTFDGLALCRSLCASHDASAIMMLHPQGTLDDLLDGYEAGADAYLLGQVDHHELFRRVEALSWPQTLPA